MGHSRITGPAAKKLADDFFPAARRLHFVHMSPDEIEWYKPGGGTDAGLRAEERTNIERALGRSAHSVVAVGPRLHDQSQAEFAGTKVLRLDPGFNSTASAATRRPPGGSPLRGLLLGRTEDAELKGVDLAAAACGQVAAWWQEDGLSGVRLLVRGAPEATVEEDRATVVRSGNDEKDTDKWARAIDRKLREPESAFRQAAELRSDLAEQVPWARAAAVVLGEIADE